MWLSLLLGNVYDDGSDDVDDVKNNTISKTRELELHAILDFFLGIPLIKMNYRVYKLHNRN